MEKAQVTIAVQTSGLTGPLGKPLLMVSAVLDRTPQEVVLVRNLAGGMTQVARIEMPDGPLKASAVDLIEAIAQDHLYTALLFYKGVQAELIDLL